MDTDTIFHWLGICVVASPAALVMVLGLTSLVGRPLNEQLTNRWTYASTVVGLMAAIGILGMMLALGTRHVPIELGNLVVIPQQHFHFHLKFVFDRLSVPFVILVLVAVRHRGGLCQSLFASRTGLRPLFRLLFVLRARAWS